MARTGTPRSAAQAFVDHLNAVLNATVSDARLSLLALPDDERAFEVTRLIDGRRAPLELLGSPFQLFVRHTIVVHDGHCQTESYAYRLQGDLTSASWILRWEYFRDPPRPDYPYPLAHVHVNGAFTNGKPIAPLHIPASRVPLESVIWHLIAEWDVAPRNDAWRALLSESVDGFHQRRTAH
ncbi:MAG TPA: hypothetical protein VND98_07300 [Solirubrobacterales bacterium]|nr:hypothetical protein [Candidatus Dormibacteraeota bacterium]HVC07370.1 hypothetical protein [Solirubrobacterales bacterium]